MNTAFISSTGDLKESRQLLNDKLIDLNVFPYAMEHFTVASIEGFEDIKTLIDHTDFFILLLGKNYGSREKKGGLSWTQKEFEYCCAELPRNNTKLLVIQMPELTKIMNQYYSGMSDEELQKLDPDQNIEDLRAQAEFVLSMDNDSLMKKALVRKEDLWNEVNRFVQRARESGTVNGWIRGIPQKGYLGLRFHEKYYQVHLSETDENYLRMGTVEFSKIHGSDSIQAKGTNFKATYNVKTDSFTLERRNKTDWIGNYFFKDDQMVGVYSATKYGVDTFDSQKMKAGVREGIHTFDFNLEIDDENSYILYGHFQDAASLHNPDLGCKTGWLYVFNTPEERLEFLKRERSNLFQDLKEAA